MKQTQQWIAGLGFLVFTILLAYSHNGSAQGTPAECSVSFTMDGATVLVAGDLYSDAYYNEAQSATGSYYVGDGGILAGAGLHDTILVENGGIVAKAGGSGTVIVKTGGVADSGGSGSLTVYVEAGAVFITKSGGHTIYYEKGATIIDLATPGPDEGTVLCRNITINEVTTE
ncbi:MAG: hypothetical protein HYU99_09465 [Deltaproteobacteria bacterium]|nr:hypothetical protein [Deltaproteobacteria bacterium]